MSKIEKRKSMTRFFAILAVVCMAFGMAACGNGDVIDSGGDDDNGGLLDRMNKLLSAQGRSYDELVVGSEGDTMTCSFFEFTISDVQALEEIDGFVPEKETNKFITAQVNVKNITEDEIPVGNYDFYIIWETEEETAEEDHWAYASFRDDMYPDDVKLASGETLSGLLVFDIPADVDEFTIAYDEIYDDEFVGDTYAVECKL